MRRVDVERLNSVILRSDIGTLDQRKALCRHLLDWFEAEKRKFYGPNRRGERLVLRAIKRHRMGPFA